MAKTCKKNRIYFLIASMLIAIAPSSDALALERNLVLFAGQSNLVAPGGIVSETGRARGMGLGRTFVKLNGESRFERMRLGINTTQYPSSELHIGRFGPEWAFAESFRNAGKTGDLIVMKWARGGTSLLAPSEWDPEAPPPSLYSRMMGEIEDMLSARPDLKGRLSCFVWGQGEADVNDPVSTYERKFRRMAATVRTAFGAASAPIVWPLLSHRSGSSLQEARQTRRFRAMQLKLARAGLGLRVFSMDDQPKIDRVHYNAAAILEYGRRAYRACQAGLAPRPQAS